MGGTKPSQRERLIEAMIVTASRYGYLGVSVARLVAQAGVSRATFYEHFADKESCFRAAYGEVAERIAAELRAVDAEEVAGRRRELLRRLLAAADREPAAARLALLESLAATTAIRAEHEQLLGTLEEMVEGYLDEASAEGPRLEIPARAMLAGLASVVAIRVFRGETGRLVDLLDDLDAWLGAYAMPPGQRRDRRDWLELGAGLRGKMEEDPSPLGNRLPRGRGALPPAVAASERRQRIIAATARVATEKGYATMTVADVVATAGVAREAFYEQFRSKQDAFLAAQAYALETSVSLAAARFFAADDWPDRVWNGLAELLRYFASVPDLAALDVVESYAAGPAAIRRSFDSRMAFTLFLEDGYRQRPEAGRLPRICSEAIAGSILELLRRQTVEGRVTEIQSLTPQVAYLALAPFIGPAAALELIEAKSDAAGR